MSTKLSRGAWAASLHHAAERFLLLAIKCRGVIVKRSMDPEVCKHHASNKQGAVPIRRREVLQKYKAVMSTIQPWDVLTLPES